MRRLFLLTFILLLCLSCATADTVPVLRDDADLLSEQEEAELMTIMEPICEYGTPLFWTTDQAGNDRSNAENFYYQMLKNESGVLFVIDVNNRQLTILTNGAIRQIIPDGDADSITDNVYRFASREEYAACAKEAFLEIIRLLHGETIARPMKLISSILLACVLALLIMYMYISRRYELRPTSGKAAALLPLTVAAHPSFTLRMTDKQSKMTKITETDTSSGGAVGGGGGHGGGGGGFSGGGGSHGF